MSGAGEQLGAGQAGRIVVSGLSKSFGAIRAVDDLSFTVEPASVTGFLGPNGAGKTTTLRALVGLVAQDAGTATIGGRAYAEIDEPTSRVGAALEASGFHPGRSGRDHLRVYCAVNGYPDRRADEVLELVELSANGDRAVRGYSTGMRQRLALATALLGDPPVLILDEPANGLDPAGIAWLRTLLRELAHEGRTILVSSHVLSEVEQTVDRVVIVHRGRLVQAGTLDELADAQPRSVIVQSPRADALAAALSAASGRVEQTGPGALRVTGLEPAQVGHIAFVEGVELHALAAERSDLEQVFFALTSDSVPHEVTEPGREVAA